MAHPSPRLHRHPSRACTLFTSPLTTSILPVFEPLTLTWDPTCVTISSNTIDLYLNVEESQGLVAVHEWTGVGYKTGKLDTTLNPGWWNASTGAGTVNAQLIITPSGQPIWNTPAPSGPMFTITYNGTYPASVTASASSPTYTGPSVESVSAPPTSAVSGSKLGAAVAVPLIVILCGVLAYVGWNKWRKRPEKKRWSAVIDQRMSMISQGTWQPPRGSMSSRPGSFHPSHRPSHSQAHSQFFADGRPSSTYSHSNSPYMGHSRGTGSAVGVNSPLAKSVSNSDLSGASGGERPMSTYSKGRPMSSYSGSPLGGPRVPLPAEMRQIGQGERASRVSFKEASYGGRPSFASTRTAGTGKTRMSWVGQPLPGAEGGGIPRNGSTKESLAHTATVTATSPTMRNNRNSMANANANVRESWADYPALAVVRDGSLAFKPIPSPTPTSSSQERVKSPFEDPPSTYPVVTRPARSSSRSGKHSPLPSPTMEVPPSPTVPEMRHMPMAERNSMMSPDQALRSYAATSSPAPSPNLPTSTATSNKPGLVRSASSFLTAPGRIFKGLGGSRTNSPAPSSTTGNYEAFYTPREELNRSPFADPTTMEEEEKIDFSEKEREEYSPDLSTPTAPGSPTPLLPPSPTNTNEVPKVVGRPRGSSKYFAPGSGRKDLRVSATPTVESRYSQASNKDEPEWMGTAL